MKHSILLTISFLLLTFLLPLQAASVNWAAVYSGKANGDTSPSLAKIGYYAAYYLPVAAATDVFHSTELTAVTDFIRANFATAKVGVETSGTALTAGDYSALEGQYGFAKYDKTPVAADEYLAVIFYENGTDREFRVFGKDSATWIEGLLVFDDTEKTAYVGDWTTASVPEPTGTVLILLGLAGLALKRKRS